MSKLIEIVKWCLVDLWIHLDSELYSIKRQSVCLDQNIRYVDKEWRNDRIDYIQLLENLVEQIQNIDSIEECVNGSDSR